jgi:hypothetical protein
VLPVGPGLMEAARPRKMHMVVSLAGLTIRQQDAALGQMSAPGHPSKLSEYLTRGTVGRRGDEVLMMLPDLGPAMPADMQVAHLDTTALIERLVREGVQVQLPGGEPRVLPVRYRELACAPGQVVLKVRNLPPEFAQVGVVPMLLDCAGYSADQAVVVREFMAPHTWSPAGAPVGNSGLVLAYVQHPPGDPCLQHLLSSFRVGDFDIQVEVETRGVNPVTPVPPPRAGQQRGLAARAAGGVAGGPPQLQGEGLPLPPGLGGSRGPAHGSQGQGQAVGAPPVAPVSGMPPPSGPGGSGGPPPGLPQPTHEVAGSSAAAAAATALPRVSVPGPDEPMPPAGLPLPRAEQGGAVVGAGGATGWQGPTCSHPWQQRGYAQQLHHHQQQQHPQRQSAVARGPRVALQPPDHPAVRATATGLPPLVEAGIRRDYAGWLQTADGQVWDAAMRDWLMEERVPPGEALEGAMWLFYSEQRHSNEFATPPASGCASAVPRWAVEWAQRMEVVATPLADGDYGEEEPSSSSNSRPASPHQPASAAGSGGGGGGGGGGRRSSTRARQQAPLPCHLPGTFQATQPHPRQGGGGGRA